MWESGNHEEPWNIKKKNLKPVDIANQFKEWVVKFEPSTQSQPSNPSISSQSERSQFGNTTKIGDFVNVQSLWSVQPDLKNKFL